MGLADNAEFREWAPLAFHRLNTSRSIAALAALLHKTELGTNEHSMSAEFLAETGDPQWFPLLLEVAQRDMKNGNYVYNAAESGEDKMLPVLLPLLHGPDEDSRQIAISALAYTGSPTAIPILLNLLRHADSETAERAVYGLRLLTHPTITSVISTDNQQWQYPRWAQWWAREGSRARIFKAAECGEFTPLD
jgi:HEAT repeat protein